MNPKLIMLAISIFASVGALYIKRRAVKRMIGHVKNWVAVISVSIFTGIVLILFLPAFIEYGLPILAKIMSAWFNLSAAMVQQNIEVFFWSFAGVIASIIAAFFVGRFYQHKKHRRQQLEQKNSGDSLTEKIKNKVKKHFPQSSMSNNIMVK